ncbi:MAG: hypothetical protein ACRD29_11435 [Acidimicrobiales bacterium]
MLEKAAADADVARLARLERAHHDDQHQLRRTLDTATHRAEKAEHRAADLEAVIGRVTDTRGDRFTMTVDGQPHTKRPDAGTHLQRLLRHRLDHTPPETSGPTTEVGTLGGLPVTAQAITTSRTRSASPSPTPTSRSRSSPTTSAAATRPTSSPALNATSTGSPTPSPG